MTRVTHRVWAENPASYRPGARLRHRGVGIRGRIVRVRPTGAIRSRPLGLSPRELHELEITVEY